MARNYAAEYQARKARYPGDLAAARGHLKPIEALRDQVLHQKWLDNNYAKFRDLRDSDQAQRANQQGMAAAKAAGEVPVDYLRDRPRTLEHRHTRSYRDRGEAEREAKRAPGYAYLVRTATGDWQVIYQPETATARMRRRSRRRSA